MVTTSSILPPDQFPQFKSQVATAFQRKPAFDPPTGSHYMYAASNDEALAAAPQDDRPHGRDIPGA